MLLSGCFSKSFFFYSRLGSLILLMSKRYILTMQACYFVSGRLGPMVTFTLKLGISILNGGNVVVQQVHRCNSIHFHLQTEIETLKQLMSISFAL